MPTLTNEEYAILTARELVNILKNLKKQKTLKIKQAHKEKLVDLAIFLMKRSLKRIKVIYLNRTIQHLRG